MGKEVRPVVCAVNGGKYWEETYKTFYLKVFVPDNDLDGQINNYGFRAPLLTVFEETRLGREEAIEFAGKTGLSHIAAKYDASVLFVYPTCDGGWEKADVSLYQELISEVSLYPDYDDGIAAFDNFFTKRFEGYFIRGAKFRADIYSYGKSADYVARNLLKTIEGQYLWGPGEITPAMCSMERLSVKPEVERKDIAVLSVGNTDEINEVFAKCENLLVKDAAEYEKDFESFVKKFKMWCGKIELEPDFEELGMTEDAGATVVNTSPDNKSPKHQGKPTHKIGWFAYYNKGLFDNGPVPLVMGFHGGGDTSMYLTYVSGLWNVCHKYGFLYVAMDDHLSVTATEIMEVIEDLKKKYKMDEKRIYAGGFSMGSGKTWNLYQEYPEKFAGFMPCSALFPIKDNPYGTSLDDPRTNKTVSKPVFYSGGEESTLPELPSQDVTCLDRVQYLASVNKLKKKFDLDYANKDQWEDKYYGCPGDEVKEFYDESRGSTLTARYYYSEDGVCRTVLASVSGQIHECREHSLEMAWKFVSEFAN